MKTVVVPVEVEKVLSNWECEDRPIDSKFAAMAIRSSLTAPSSEPVAQAVAQAVAWMWEQAEYHENDLRGRGWRPTFGTQDPKCPWMTRNVTPLYAHPPAAAPAVEVPPDAICKWTHDDDGIWNSACGKAFVLNDGTPAENSMKFCHACGKPLRALLAKGRE